MKSSNEHIPFLDYLRGVAILAVFLCHCYYNGFASDVHEFNWNGWLPDLRNPLNECDLFFPMLGWIGVGLFFAISGFCIHLSHERTRGKDWGVFWLRRFFRLYPAYLVTLLVFAFIFPGSRLDFSTTLLHTRPHYVFSSIQLGTHLALVHNFSDYTVWAINVPLWSIAVEVQLYLLYPLLLLLAKFFGWYRMLWITAIIELSLRACESWLGTDLAVLTKNPLYFWFSWSVGAALAEAYLKAQPLPFTGRLRLMLPFMVLISSQIKPLVPFCFTLASLTAVYLMSYWLTHPDEAPTDSKRSASYMRHLRAAGLISYSFYLIHVPFLNLWGFCLGNFFSAQTVPFVRYVLCLPAWFFILVPAYFLYRYVELPGIAWGKWWIEQRRQRQETQAAAVLAAGKP